MWKLTVLIGAASLSGCSPDTDEALLRCAEGASTRYVGTAFLLGSDSAVIAPRRECTVLVEFPEHLSGRVESAQNASPFGGAIKPVKVDITGQLEVAHDPGGKARRIFRVSRIAELETDLTPSEAKRSSVFTFGNDKMLD